MCGITGFIDFKNNSTQAMLEGMNDAIAHRGPDDAGCEIYKVGDTMVGFAQRRLSILDLSPLGHQPMHYRDLTINFNGEVYNFREVREELTAMGYGFSSESDTEVIIKAFDCWGTAAVAKFTGMFAIAILDRAARKLMLIRDRAGVKPLYFYHKQDLVLFGSELKALFRHPQFQKDIDTNSLALYLNYSYIPAPHCIFKNTFKLLPGHILTVDLATVSTIW